MLTSVKELRSREELDEALRAHSSVVLHFWASWCQASAHMDSVFSQLCTDTPQARFYRVEAEEQPEISERYGVPAVPFFVFIKDGAVVDKLEGANPAELANKVAKLAGPLSLVKAAAPASLGMAAGPMVLEAVKDIAIENGAVQAGSVSSDDVKVRIEQLLDANPVLLFMKGTPQEPRCGFSRKVVDALNAVGVKFDTFDILTDEDIRQGLKIFSNWPTYPQLYCKGELLGGCDVVLEMQKNGELQEILVEKGLLFPTKHAARSDIVPTPEPTPAVFTEAKIPVTTEAGPGLSELLKTRLRNLIDSSNIMLFMKGTKEEPRCGFSKRMVEALKEEGLDFGSFDILSDDEVRQGLKIFSNWPTYPQLYIKGELIGGSDIVLEMHKSGELKQTFAEKGLLQLGNTKSDSEPLEDRLKRLIESSPTMLFMKGTPDVPRCKFSTKVVNVLKESGITFGSFDILTDEEVREGLKTYSNWPTFPQLYHNGQLIGGCDIVLDMQKMGELMLVLSG